MSEADRVEGDGREYLFLMRHAEQRAGQLTERGRDHLRVLGERLTEWVEAAWLADRGRRIRVWRVTGAPEVSQTADLLGSCLRQSRLCVDSTALPPDATARKGAPEVVLTAYLPDREAFSALCSWVSEAAVDGAREPAHPCHAPLLIGNDPLIGWIASELLGHPTAVSHGELLCLVRDGRTGGVASRLARHRRRWRLVWTISRDGRDEAATVREKIRAKMSAAAALGTVVVGLTTFLLQEALARDPSLLQWLAFAALGSSATLYFASLFLYDSLQMPERFWGARFEPSRQHPGALRGGWARVSGGRPSVARPPSSTARVLHAAMVQVWTWIFAPATYLAGLGAVLYALGVAPGGQDDLDVRRLHVLVGLALLAVALTTWVAVHRPRLGASD